MAYVFQVATFDPLTVTSTTPGPTGPQGGIGPQGPSGPVVDVSGVHPDASGHVDLSGTYLPQTVVRVNVRQYGAKGDGSTSDVAAFNSAIAAANAYNPNPVDQTGVIGVTLYLPDGDYIIDAPLNPITRSGVTVVGESQTGTRFIIKGAAAAAGAAAFTWGTVSQAVIGGGIQNAKIEYTDNPGAGSVAVALSNASLFNFSDLLLVHVGTLIQLGTSSVLPASAVVCSRIIGSTYNGGSPVWDCRWGAGLFIGDCHLGVAGVLAPSVNRTSTMTTVPGTNVINAGSYGTWDTIQIGNSTFERFYYGLLFNAVTSVVVNDIHVANTYFDYIRNDVIACVPSGGVVAGVYVSSTWLVSWEATDVLLSPSGGGWVKDVSLSDINAECAGTHSLQINPGVSYVSVRGGNWTAANRTNVNALGFYIGGGDHIVIVGTMVGSSGAAGGYPWQAVYGVATAADVDSYVIEGVIAEGTASGFSFNTNTAGSKNRLVLGNVNASYAGVQTGGIFTVPASGAAFTNTTPTTVQVYLFGGAVTAVSKNGVQISGMTAGSLTLAPGESYSVTYTTAPSVTYFVLP